MQNSESILKSYFNVLRQNWNCVGGVSGLCPSDIVILLSLWYSFNLCDWHFFKVKLVNFETLDYKNISKGWRLISTYCSIIGKQSSSDQLDNQLSRWSLWLLGYDSFFSSDLLYKVGPSSKGSTPPTFGVQRFLRPWLIFKKISTPLRYFYN